MPTIAMQSHKQALEAAEKRLADSMKVSQHCTLLLAGCWQQRH
jgi:hypothetical protein